MVRLFVVELLLKALDLSLKLIRYQRVYRILLLLSPEPKPIQDLPRALALARVVNSAALSTRVQATCLRRSLLLWWLLRWKRIPSQVQLGMGPSGGHAWVEHAGKIVNDRPDVGMNYPIRYNMDLATEKTANFDR